MIVVIHSKPVISSDVVGNNNSVRIAVKVKNTGTVKGKETVQLYIGDEKCSLLRPKKELNGFCKVELEPQEEKTVTLNIDANALKFLTEVGRRAR